MTWHDERADRQPEENPQKLATSRILQGRCKLRQRVTKEIFLLFVFLCLLSQVCTFLPSFPCGGCEVTLSNRLDGL